FCGRKAHRLQTPAGMVPAVPVEGVFNECHGVRRTALVGVGEPGEELPVLLVELDDGPGALTDAMQQQLLARATCTPWADTVRVVLAHPGFPLDARHNAKSRRELLKTWATEQLNKRPQLPG